MGKGKPGQSGKPSGQKGATGGAKFPVSSGKDHRNGVFKKKNKGKKGKKPVKEAKVVEDPVNATGRSNWEALRDSLTKQHVEKKRKRAADAGKDVDAIKDSTSAPSKRPKLAVKAAKDSDDEASDDDSEGSLNGDPSVLEGNDHGGRMTKVVAMDCEMVGVGPDGTKSALARVSIVNYEGDTLLDRYCRPSERVTDFRTYVSGIRPKHIFNAPKLRAVQDEVAKVLQGRILVGHALKNDMQALLLSHPKRDIRDTARYKPLRKNGRPQKLKALARQHLGVAIQTGMHSSVIDARATMGIYKKIAKSWEKQMKPTRGGGKRGKKAKRARSDDADNSDD